MMTNPIADNNLIKSTNNVSSASQTPDSVLKKKLKQLMPEAFSEGKLDIDTLKSLLGDDVLAPMQEAYGLNWAGKHHVYRELKTATSQTLLPQPDQSIDFDTTDNLFIEGDNLAVLKVLQKSYYNRIKMIYIDPPYNTGNDRFIYPDDYSESLAEYQARAGQLDDDGNLTHSDGMRSNRKENGQYHSNWLNMMYPRLALAKNLLRDDGVIFVSIDDNEVANLRLLMDEIFGEENFVAEIVWQKKYAATNDAKGFSTTHDYIISYQKTSDFKRNLLPRTEEQNKPYKYDDNDGRGLWRSDNVLVKSYSENAIYPIKNPNTGKEFYPAEGSSWRASKETMDKWLAENRIYFGKDGTGAPQLKRYLNEVQQGRVPMTWWDFREVGHNDGANRELKKLFDTRPPFDTPKPTTLIRQMMLIGTNSGDIILDFFAGSSTTAHAVMALNAEDAKNNKDNAVGKRKFIMVQIPEAIEEDSEAHKAGFPTIAEISKERIRRAGQQIITDNPDLKDSNLDIGFKAYKLSDSNFIPWQQPETRDANSLLALLEKHINPIVEDATDNGIVTELMLKEGYPLTANIEQADGYYLVTQKIEVNPVEQAGTDRTTNKTETITLAIVLNDMSADKTEHLIALKPSKTIILDNAFSDDDNKANTLLQFEDAGLVVGCV